MHLFATVHKSSQTSYLRRNSKLHDQFPYELPRKGKHLTRNTKELSETNDLLIYLMSLPYVLSFMEYWSHAASKYTSNFTHHSITNLKVLPIFYDCCVSGLTCECGLNCVRRQLEEMQPRLL